MAMKPYPSNLIVFDIADKVFDEELKLDIVRSWTHIGEVLVRTHTTPEGDGPRNVIRIKVKYGCRPYLAKDGGESDANWAERMEQHLLSTMRKVSSNVVAHNRRRRREGLAEIEFASMEFELERGALMLEFLLDSNGEVPVECAHMAGQIREALAAGELGAAVRVVAPSPAAYDAQAAAARAAREQAQAEQQAHAAEQKAAEQEAAEQAEEQAAERFMESPELVAAEEAREQEQAAEQDEQQVSPLEVKPLSRLEWDALYGRRDADFKVDYHLWQVVDAQGEKRDFDSAAHAFVA